MLKLTNVISRRGTIATVTSLVTAIFLASRAGAAVGRDHTIHIDLQLCFQNRVDALLEIGERELAARRARRVAHIGWVAQGVARAPAASAEQSGREQKARPAEGRPGGLERAGVLVHRHGHPVAIQAAIFE